MRKLYWIVGILVLMILPMVSAVCVVPIHYKASIDNIQDFPNYVFIAQFYSSYRESNNNIIYSDNSYTFINTSNILSPTEEKTWYLREVYAVKKIDFNGVKQLTINRKMDSCGNIIVNDVENNSCNVSGYSMNGASYLYPYNFEIDSNYTKLNISYRFDVGAKDCGDDTIPNAREDHLTLFDDKGVVNVKLNNSVFYYQNGTTIIIYPDKNGQVNNFMNNYNKQLPTAPSKVGFFQGIINWFKRLFGGGEENYKKHGESCIKNNECEKELQCLRCGTNEEGLTASLPVSKTNPGACGLGCI